MLRRDDLDDDTIERLLTGDLVPGQELLGSFVDDAHLVAAGEQPKASGLLAAIFTDELSVRSAAVSDIPAADTPRPAAAGGSPRRRKNVIGTARAKLASLGLAAKVGVATGALALTGTAAAATGSLPDAAQDRVADAFSKAGINIPGGAADAHRQDADRRGEAGVDDADDADVEAAETPEQADFGSGVADRATSGEPQDDGRQFGEDVSDEARETFQPADRPTAESNPGTGFRDQAPAGGATDDGDDPESDDAEATDHRPAGTPTAHDNPGTSRRP